MLIVMGIGLVAIIGMFSILMSMIFDKPHQIHIDTRYISNNNDDENETFSVIPFDDDDLILTDFEEPHHA